MGNQLKHQHSGRPKIRHREVPRWLDPATRALVEDMVTTMPRQRDDVLAIVLYGSVARHEERSLDDPHPSDVDVLMIFDTDDEHVAVHEGERLFQILGRVYDRHLDTQRDIKVMFASRGMREWDPTFVANVARDGWVLWARKDRLPLPLPSGDAWEPPVDASMASGR